MVFSQITGAQELKYIMKKIKLAVSCGGTGGHFYPGLATACELIASGGDAILLLSGKNGKKWAAVARDHNVKAVVLPEIPSPSFKRPGAMLKFIFGTLKGAGMAKAAMREFAPDAFLCMGSFASLPTMRAARSLKLKCFLHDGNAKVGKANRFFSRKAEFLGIAFPPVNPEKLHCPWAVTGMPLRLDTVPIPREEAIANLDKRYSVNLDPRRLTILIFGGSQGARSINVAFSRVLLELSGTRNDIQVIHLCGNPDYEVMTSLWKKADFPVLLLPYSDEMQNIYSCADLAVSRSGGSSVAELALFGIPSILVPYPFAAENHQWYNAEYLAKAGAARIVSNDECNAKAGQLLEEFLTDPAHFQPSEPVFRSLAKPGAAAKLLEEITKRL